jgi:hypothetical protein
MPLIHSLGLTLLLSLSTLTVNSAADDDDGTWTYTLSGDEATVTGCVATCPTELVIPAKVDGFSVASIGDSAFQGNLLESVSIPDSVVTIGSQAFADWGVNQGLSISTLRKVVLGDGVESIGAYAFRGAQISEVNFPPKLTYLGHSAYEKSNVSRVSFSGANLTEIFSGTFSQSKLKAISLPEGLLKIGENAFYQTPLETLNLPSSLIDIGASAFFGTKLVEVVIPNSVKNIGDEAFSYSKIKNLTLGLSLETIGKNAFQRHYLYESQARLIIPESVRTIGFTAFSNVGSAAEQAVINNFAVAIVRLTRPIDSSRSLFQEKFSASAMRVAIFYADEDFPKLDNVVCKQEIVHEAGTDFDALATLVASCNTTSDFFQLAADYIDNFYDYNTEIKLYRSNVDSQLTKSQSLWFTLTDYHGNESGAVDAPRNLVVSVRDTIPPTIRLIGPDTVTVVFGSEYEEAGAFAEDSFDENPKVEISGQVDEKIKGVYLLSYHAVDDSGNQSEYIERTVIVDSDTDLDGEIDAVDSDIDGDGVLNSSDSFPFDYDENLDTDGDSIGNNADTDDDNDGALDVDDAYPLISLGDLTDTDGDGRPNDCATDCQGLGMTADTDDDNDGVIDRPMWIQLGDDIDGEVEFDLAGLPQLSSDGSVVAIGALQNNGSDFRSGHVRVYAWDGSSWAQRGGDIDGEARLDLSGIPSLSSDGSVVAIGARLNDGNGADSGHVRIYAWGGNSWVQRGNDIDGEAAGDQSGYSASLSADGTVVAIGAPLNDGNGADSGQVRIYAWDGSSWVQRGEDIDGEAAGDQSFFPSLSSDGTVVAIGAPTNDGNGADSGHVRIYAWDGSSWVQRGNDIDGEAAGDQSALIIKLSADSSVVAIGALLNDGNGDDSGHVRVYAWDGNSWVQRGEDIDGEAAGDNSGIVALTADGGLVAIGAEFNDGNGDASGHVRVYAWDGNSWVQRGEDIDGEAAGDLASVVALSSDSGAVAIGGYRNDGNGIDSGHVRIYSFFDSFDAFPLDASETADSDSDGVGDNSDAFPDDATESLDSDNDSVGDNADNCPSLSNSDQLNTDGDSEGDACDSDDDNDGFSDDQEELDGTNPKSRFSCRSGCFSFDVDESLQAQPLTDGLLVIRHLFGFSGDSLISGAVSGGASRDGSDAIASYLTDAVSELDIDGDGESKPLTDGLLLIRYLFGFSGDSLISGAIGSGAERDTAEEVEAYIEERVPVQ